MKSFQSKSGTKQIAMIAVATAVLGLVTSSGWAQGYTPGNIQVPPPQPAEALPPAYPGVVVQTPVSPSQVPQLAPSQVADLTASIALYPDPLLAAIFPAATYPLDVASANQWLATHPNPDELTIQGLPYQPAVKTLVHYPTVLAMMANHLDWTQALGAAVSYQQGDVISSIQNWRATALADGTLATTPQQEIVTAGPTIEILPVTPDVVYVPVYDPAVVYVRHPAGFRDGIRFDVAGKFGGWLDFDLDWHDRVVRVPTQPYWERHVDDHQRWDEIHRAPAVIVENRDRVGGPRVVVPEERPAFVRGDNNRPTYPDRIVTTDKKVINVPGGKALVVTPDARGRDLPRDDRGGRGPDDRGLGDRGGRDQADNH